MKGNFALVLVIISLLISCTAQQGCYKDVLDSKAKFAASSSKDGVIANKPPDPTVRQYGWCPDVNDNKPWISADLGKKFVFSKLEFSTTIPILFKVSWSETAEHGKWIALNKWFQVIKPIVPQQVIFADHEKGDITGRHIRLHLRDTDDTVDNKALCISFDVYGCQAACTSHTCPIGSECTVNRYGVENCDQCIPGFLKSKDGKCLGPSPCNDKSVCGTNATCISSTPHSFICLCKKGYIGDPTRACQECGPGYKDNGTGCIDVDECKSVNNSCHLTEDCINTDGSYVCRCRQGFRQKSNGRGCIDVNECKGDEPDLCPSDITTCVNQDGYFECACKEDGYILYGGQCLDVNECKANLHQCKNALCKNTDGSYKCSCKSGYKFKANDPLQRQCVDIDECAEEDYQTLCGIMDAYCKNTIGSYKCLCARGYSMNKEMKKCVDRDECLENWPCSEFAFCRNEVGTYRCTCKPGYAGDGKTCVEDLGSTQSAKTKRYAIFAGAGGGALLLIIAIITFACLTRKKAPEKPTIEMQEGLMMTGFDPGFELAPLPETAEGDWTFMEEEEDYGSSEDSDDSDIGTVFQSLISGD